MSGSLRIVSHEATRTGAPLVLLGLLRHARPSLETPFDVRIRLDGPLSADLRALHDDWSRLPPAAVLVNSSLAADALHDEPPVPSAVYVHEEGDTLADLGPAHLRALRERATLVFAVSERSAGELRDLGVPAERIRLLPPLVAPPPGPLDRAEIAAVRGGLGATDDVPLVLGCGEATWRKGPDLFVETIRHLRLLGELRAAWVGRRFAPAAHQLDHDTRAAGLEGVLHWTGELPDVTSHLAAADLLLMTSREDPRPLVPVEAAAVGTATVGFQLGGMADLAARGAAVTVPYPDTVALARAARDLLDDGEHRSRLVAATRARAAEQSSAASGDRFVELVRELLSMHGCSA